MDAMLHLSDCGRYFPAWEADHIQARFLGGSDELDNLRTLCAECHKAVTAEQARERAVQRRDAKGEA